jgi:transposase
MSVILTPGQAGDNPQLLLLLDQIAVGRDGPGRPRKRPERVLADKAYSHPSTRAALRSRGIAFTSPERIDQINRRQDKGSHGGRPPSFDPDLYADRNVVERCFNRLKQFRARHSVGTVSAAWTVGAAVSALAVAGVVTTAVSPPAWPLGGRTRRTV